MFFCMSFLWSRLDSLLNFQLNNCFCFQGMHAGLPKYVPVNLKDIEEAGFQEGEEVSLETLKEKGLINPSGRERKLPLKVLLSPASIVRITEVNVKIDIVMHFPAPRSDIKAKCFKKILFDSLGLCNGNSYS